MGGKEEKKKRAYPLSRRDASLREFSRAKEGKGKNSAK